jgi:transcriptional antiterminator RfaH
MQQLVNGSKQSREVSEAWYCLRSRRKLEQVAAARVKVLGNTSVFCPRIRFRRPNRDGWVWVTEALFPGYFFARFSLKEMLPQVRSAHGVTSVVHFGDWYPEIANNIIEELQADTPDGSVCELVRALVPGDNVRLLQGPLAGAEAVITHVLPGHERVRLLLDFLGRETFAEVEADNVVAAEGVGFDLLKFSPRISNVEKSSEATTILSPFDLELPARNGTDG